MRRPVRRVWRGYSQVPLRNPCDLSKHDYTNKIETVKVELGRETKGKRMVSSTMAWPASHEGWSALPPQECLAFRG